MCLDIAGDSNWIHKDDYGYLQDISEGYLDGIFWLESWRSVTILEDLGISWLDISC